MTRQLSDRRLWLNNSSMQSLRALAPPSSADFAALTATERIRLPCMFSVGALLPRPVVGGPTDKTKFGSRLVCRRGVGCWSIAAVIAFHIVDNTFQQPRCGRQLTASSDE